MIMLRSDDLWSELEKLFKSTRTDKNYIKAAVAYVSDDSCISFGKGDVLVVDASDVSIQAGRTSATVLQNAHKNGADLYSCDALHAKVAVFGDQHVYIGSANISSNSRNNLHEAGVITEHPNVIGDAVQLIDELTKKSTKIDNDFISRIIKIEVEKSHPLPKKQSITASRSCTWLVSLRNDAVYPGDEDKVDKDNESIKTSKGEKAAWFWMGTWNNFFKNAKIGDSVVRIERGETKSIQPNVVYRHCTIQKISIENKGRIKVYHYASNNKLRIIWSEFKKLAENSGIPDLRSGLSTVRKLSPQQSDNLFLMWSQNKP